MGSSHLVVNTATRLIVIFSLLSTFDWIEYKKKAYLASDHKDQSHIIITETKTKGLKKAANDLKETTKAEEVKTTQPATTQTTETSAKKNKSEKTEGGLHD